MSVNTTDPMIGRLIDGRYQVRSRIARGGMATVYLATDLRLERRVAIKIMHGHLADDSQFKQRFIQEARSAARLAHPNVVNVFDQGQDSESAYLVMEYLPGITLRELLQDYGALTSEQTIDISEAVLSGLAAAHKAGIVHRDLKPENVLLADDGRIKIGDFGLARAANNNTATGAALLGTIAYLSPELVTRGVADTRSDIYAVGIMMYEMLTGEQPFKGEQPMQIAYQHANDSVPTPSTKNPKVPAELDELVLWATARDPQDRPDDARALLEQLHDTEALLQTALPASPTSAQRTMVLPSAPLMPPPSDAETQVIGGRTAAPVSHTDEVSENTSALNVRSGKRRRRGPILILVIVLLAALAGGAGWWFGLGPGSQVQVPGGLQGLSVADATTQLEAAELVVAAEQTQQSSSEVAAGAVLGTDPPEGTSLARGAEVTLIISSGPEPVTLEQLAGRNIDEARQYLSQFDITIAENPQRVFDAEVPADEILSAALGEQDLSAGGDTFHGVEIAVAISAGALPDISGATPEVATQLLSGVELTVGETREDYNDDIAAGRVIGLVEAGPLSPGGSVTLAVSRGPEQVVVPEGLAGMSRTDAVAALEAVGLRASYNPIFEAFPGAIVDSTSPASGDSVDLGSTVNLYLQLFG